MTLSQNLTGLVLLVGLTACAGNTPRKPAGAESKSNPTSLQQACYDATNRGQTPPRGCPQNDQNNRGMRTVPGIEIDPLLFPSQSGAGLPGRGVLGR